MNDAFALEVLRRQEAGDARGVAIIAAELDAALAAIRAALRPSGGGDVIGTETRSVKGGTVERWEVLANGGRRRVGP